MERVTLGKPKVEGIDPQYTGLVVVRVPVETKLPQGWREVFTDNPHFSGWPISMQKPRLHGTSVEIHVPDGEVEQGDDRPARAGRVGERYVRARRSPGDQGETA